MTDVNLYHKNMKTNYSQINQQLSSVTTRHFKRNQKILPYKNNGIEIEIVI